MADQSWHRPLQLALGHVGLGFQAAEKGLHMGVVIAIRPAAHALSEPVGDEQPFEAVGCVLDALIRVEQRSVARPMSSERVAERRTGQFCRTVLRGCPAENPPSELIHDHGEEQPTALSVYVSVIAHPHFSFSCCRAAFKQPVRHLVLRCSARPRSEPACLLRHQALFTHQASYAMTSARVSHVVEHPLEPRAAVNTAMSGERLAQRTQQLP